MRSKFSSADYTKARSGRGGGLGKMEDTSKVQEYGKLGFDAVKKRIAQELRRQKVADRLEAMN